jgi:uncharacterized Zn finger protein
MADFSGFGPRRKVSGGIEARTKRGAFGETWWGRHFVTAMEQLADPGRISRGRTYARGGQVLTLGIERGEIHGDVQGSQLDPFSASVYVEPLSESEVAALVERVRFSPGMLGELASGAIPIALGPMLLPQDKRQLDFDCNCPDDGWPCKHAAALMYIAAEQIDASALSILDLRGVDLDTIIASIEGAVDVAEQGVDDLDDWFGDSRARPALPAPEFAAAPDDLDPLVLRRALRSAGADEREVGAVVAELASLYRRLGE